MLNRRGFTLVELVAALAIAALIAGILVPQLMSRLSKGESGALVTNLRNLSDAIASYRTDLGAYPRQLAYLSAPPAAGTQDLCSVNLPNVALWRGPYLDRTISTNGLASGGSTIANAIVRDPTSTVTTTAYANLVIQVNEVDLAIANDVESQLDGDGSLTTGAVRWTVGSVAGRGTLYYRIPIRGC
jgi:prepilin-type N-terminal cleavage/methylation domain-containing protein